MAGQVQQGIQGNRLLPSNVLTTVRPGPLRGATNTQGMTWAVVDLALFVALKSARPLQSLIIISRVYSCAE